jgi:molybdate transport system permease protein
MGDVETAHRRVRRKRRRAIARTPLLFLALGGLLVICLIAPIVYGFTQLTGPEIAAVVTDPQAPWAIATSFGTASMATAVIAVVGVPLAHALSRQRGWRARLLGLLVALPLALPPMMSGILLLMLIGPYGPVGAPFAARGWELTDSLAGIVVAQVFVAAPYAVIGARSAFAVLDHEIEEAATLDGCSLWAVFRFVALPMAWPGVAASLVLSWLRALGEFGATLIVAYHPYTLPVYVWVQFSSTGLGAALPLVALMLVLTALILVVVGDRPSVLRA